MRQETGTNAYEKSKRKLKTPAQVEALEEFYNEHKYPSEVMKLEFAKRIGLSDKQVSGWFCHRRLKEKKTMEGEICTNGKQHLSSSAIHDRTSGVRQESCSSTKQVDRNLDSKEVESKNFYGYNSSAAVVACEASNKHANDGHFDVLEDRSSDSSSSASHGRFQQNNEKLCIVQPSRYKFWDESCMLMSSKNTGIKSKVHKVKSRYSFLQDENETPAISAVKWKLGSHFQEDGPRLGFEFDPLPPGAFDSPVQDSKCEPYYVGDSMQHEFSAVSRSIKEPSVYDKCTLEKLTSKAYPEQKGFKRTKQGFNDCNEITELQSTKKAFISNHREHVQYQTIVTDMVDNSVNQTSSFNVRKTRYFKYKTEGRYENNFGYDLHQDYSSSYNRNSFPYLNCDTQVFRGEHFDTASLIAVGKKHASIGLEYQIQPKKSLKKKIRKETQENHYSFQKEMLISNNNKTSRKMHGVKFWK